MIEDEPVLESGTCNLFSEELENLMEEYIMSLNEPQHSLTLNDIRLLSYDFMVKWNVVVPDHWNKEKKSSSNWVYDFLNRYPQIKDILGDVTELKIKEENFIEETNDADNHSTSGSSDSSEYIKEEEIEIDVSFSSSDDELDVSKNSDANKNEDEFFNNYLKLHPKILTVDCELSEVDISKTIKEFTSSISSAYRRLKKFNCVCPNRIFNLNEITLIINPSKNNIKKNELTVTACCCINAAGDSVPPYLVFPRIVFKETMLKDGPKGLCGTGVKNGLVNEHIFVNVLDHFQRKVRVSSSNIAILILDDKDYHVTPNSLQFCEQHGIVLIILPPYAEILQPIEIISRSLHKQFKKSCSDLKQKYPDKSIKIYDVAPILNFIYPTVFDNSKIKSAFEMSGFWPLDEEIFKRECYSTITKGRKDHFEEVTVSLSDCDAELESVEEIEGEPEIEEEFDFTPSLPSKEAPKEMNPLPYVEFDKTPMEEFFNNLISAYNQLSGNNPQKIYNLDEIELVVYLPCASRSVRNERILITACCFISAAGDSLPPFLIYPQTNFNDALLTSAPEGSRSSTSKSGLMNGKIFIEVLQHFQDYVHATIDDPVVILLDTDESHITINSLDLCKEIGILLVTVPPHISEPLQPLEKTVFKSLQVNFSREYREFINSGKSMSVLNILLMLKLAYPKAFNASNIIEGFQSTGLWPLDQNLFALDKLCSTYTEKPQC